jgi:hypothetical protein
MQSKTTYKSTNANQAASVQLVLSIITHEVVNTE